tara:strand:- start:2817 stop:3245 length:429 start_codon:yes stop_codon:yes gene_type:complete
MYHLKRYLLLFIFAIIISNCSEKISYSGKILNENNINYNQFTNINELVEKMGNPNFIDPIEKKYYYFSEQKKIRNFFKQKITNRNIIVFKFDSNNQIINFEEYDLNNENDVKYIEEKTPNESIKRGLLEKIFGGVSATAPTQ